MGVIVIPESSEESEALGRSRISYLKREYEARCKPYERDLRQRIGDHLSKEATLFDAGSAAFHDTGIATKAFPSLFSSVDSNGLVNVSSLKHLGGGAFDVDGLTVFAHRFFRRSFSHLNPINFQFFSTVNAVMADGVDFWIALDEDVVGWSASFLQVYEAEYWWGPKFSDDLSSIEPGITTGEAIGFSRLYTGVSRTEFWWQSRKGEHILELEELKDVPSLDLAESYGCRYLHSIVDESTHCLRHLDGAVRVYTEEEMVNRLGCKIKNAGRHTEYTKLWRIDNDISVSEWKRLVSDYFRDNHLVGVYLGAQDHDRRELPTLTKDIETYFTPKQKYVPYGIDKDSGIRVNLSYHQQSQNCGAPREVVPLDSLMTGPDHHTVMDLWIIEIQKILNRRGQALSLPTGARLAACEDMYINLPLISHRSGDRAEITETFDGICQLLRWSEKNEHNRAVSINVSFPISDREMRLSLYGHCRDLLNFLDSEFVSLPMSDGELDRWCNKLADWMKSQTVSDRPIPHEIIQPSGIVWLKRQPIPEDIKIDFTYCEEKRGVKYEAKLPAKYSDLHASLQGEEIAVRCCYLIDEVACDICNDNWLNCPCSVVLDGARKIIKRITPAGVFFTDKPA